ncbi:hypothetical protein, partial [Mesorhizobium sp. M4B.F.Ca.ET.169.01.1.1]|uniref:hypothetical protein n=1 Tax=Mesorhizobium sp. M4B.F.Ca.ET.169.01.1.1 TaxID=2563949 RepID=UPI001AED84C7
FPSMHRTARRAKAIVQCKARKEVNTCRIVIPASTGTTMGFAARHRNGNHLLRLTTTVGVGNALGERHLLQFTGG